MGPVMDYKAPDQNLAKTYWRPIKDIDKAVDELRTSIRQQSMLDFLAYFFRMRETCGSDCRDVSRARRDAGRREIPPSKAEPRPDKSGSYRSSYSISSRRPSVLSEEMRDFFARTNKRGRLPMVIWV